MLKIHYLQHAFFEGFNSLRPWFEQRGHDVTGTLLYKGESLPRADDFDWLVIMGGPMGAGDEEIHPWLKQEKSLIRDAVNQDKAILGICLGAQLVAEVLGAEVTRNPEREIGWHPVKKNPALEDTHFANIFPGTALLFHWHSDTFSAPPGTINIGSSQACANQGFVKGDRIIGLQCHPEANADFVYHLIENCHDEIIDSTYVQTAAQMLEHQKGNSAFDEGQQIIHRILAHQEQQITGSH